MCVCVCVRLCVRVVCGGCRSQRKGREGTVEIQVPEGILQLVASRADVPGRQVFQNRANAGNVTTSVCTCMCAQLARRAEWGHGAFGVYPVSS